MLVHHSSLPVVSHGVYTFIFLFVLGMKPNALYMPGKHSTPNHTLSSLSL
jgi:hypothetical protein